VPEISAPPDLKVRATTLEYNLRHQRWAKDIQHHAEQRSPYRGTRVRFSSAALPLDDWMEGVVTNYIAADGAILVTIDLISDS
jgi:hypothetical protein